MLHPTKGGLLLKIKVTPQAKKNEVLLTQEGLIHVKVTAPPEDNKANQAVIALLSETLEISKSCLEVVKGHSSRRKTLLISHASLESVKEKFATFMHTLL